MILVGRRLFLALTMRPVAAARGVKFATIDMTRLLDAEITVISAGNGKSLINSDVSLIVSYLGIKRVVNCKIEILIV